MATHHFQPEHYHTTLGTHAPVLHIADGDTVVTTTVDAGGRDSANNQVTPGGNPQTGPFYIEGAQPGDSIAVHFDRLWPNRASGFTGTVLAAGVVDPWYVTRFPKERQSGEWEIDLEKGTATLAKPETALGRFTLPLRPMLGCFGVAPWGGQAISTATSA